LLLLVLKYKVVRLIFVYYLFLMIYFNIYLVHRDMKLI
jgi:hypothetical protein